MYVDGGSVEIAFVGSCECDFEFPWEVGEFGVESGPLSDEFCDGSWVFDFVFDDACPVVCGDISDAISAGLECVHFDVGEGIEDICDFGKFWPVELDILSCGEVTVAFVVGIGDEGEGVELF